MSRERAFFDVFPTYTTEDPEIKEMFGSVKVESIECNEERDRIRVSFVSDHLIHKKVILKAERELQKTIYPKKNGQIRLHERFRLSERYDLENLFREYGNSMLYELKVLSPIMFQLYKESDRKIDQGNRFIIVMADNFIAHDHENMLKDYLYGVICERCGIKNVSINIQYKDKEEREELRRTREDIRAQISEISRRAAESASKKPEVKKTYTRRTGKEYKKTYSHRSSSYVKNSDDPKVFYKGDVPEQATPIKDIIGDMYGITVRGMIRHTEEKLSKNEQWIIMMFDITDFTDTIAVRLVVKSEEAGKLRDHLKEGNFIKLKGNAVQTEYERELTISSIAGMREIDDFREYRMDYSSEKRVELHCHTKMSRMDAVSDLMDLTKTALRWGWKSFAITDHGNVQAFQTTVNGKFLKKLGQPLPEDFKFIYGMEGYLVDDLQEIVGRAGEPSDYSSYRLDDTFCAFDIETTGLSPVEDRIIEIGAVLIQNGKIVDRFDEFVDPERPIPYRIEQLTGINDHMVSEADKIDKVLPRFLDFTRGAALIGHNVRFDAGFIEENAKRLDIPFDRMHIDTMGLSRLLLPKLAHHRLNDTANEFSYLGSDKAYEVVIKNPNEISDRIEKVSPVRPDKCSPKLADSDNVLRQICYKKAHEIYGDTLPKAVEDRLETELTSIISNGYADLYIIAQKLVWKSNEDGYMVGSRGSVGSSFVAYLAGITEVNSLPPHYICPKCHYSDFDSEAVHKYALEGTCGIDMEDKICPECGEKLNKLGFDIPFQTFLGFKGDKEPDIDLNFSSEYQSKAHKYTEVIFGKGHTFRAGTMTTLAEKTAFGYAKNYYEKRGIVKRGAEIARIAEGFTGVLKTTGQHPGGIVVLPHGEEIHSFTPIQHPADKTEGSSITTHFEYHSIEHNLLKLDILGHDDPTMIKRLKDITGVDPESIPFDDEKVMSLFQDTFALGVKPSDIDGIPNGALGIPEFGTNFVIKMLVDAKPQNISDLVRISGLSHGTDVWIGNADELIKNGTATLGTCICCRDDIMIYLIGKGMDKQLSFKTMESVRKGNGLQPEMEEAMHAADVPQWYLDSCRKIKYMFPKAHAAAYVMMAWRVGWYKIYRPLEYYSAFFSIRAKAFSYETCCMGKGALLENIKEYKSKEKLSDAEKSELHERKLVLEMYARGYEFMPIDLYQVDARYCKVIDGKIMPHLSSITGIGTKVASDIVDNLQASPERGPFLSTEDFRTRSGASEGVAEQFKKLGILGEIPETNQLSLFDM